jgi:hypothetical protein
MYFFERERSELGLAAKCSSKPGQHVVKRANNPHEGLWNEYYLQLHILNSPWVARVSSFITRSPESPAPYSLSRLTGSSGGPRMNQDLPSNIGRNACQLSVTIE